MNKMLRWTLLCAGWLFASTALGHFWLASLAGFIPLPDAVWQLAERVYAPRNADALAALEFWVFTSLSATLLLALWLPACWLWRRR